MIHLSDYIKENKIEILEKEFFESIYNWPNGLLNIQPIGYSELIYDDYKSLIYQDIIQETLTKTYDFSKFKEYLNKQFSDNIQFNIDYNEHPRFVNYKNNNRLLIQVDKNFKDEDIQQACDLFGYKIAGITKDKIAKLYYIEPIYFNEISAKINKMKYLYHVVPLDDNRTFGKIKQSFQKKYGLKPSRREKISNHFRRLYCFTEDANEEDFLNFANRNKSLNDFLLIRIRLKDYLEDFKDREIEWFEDPNMKNGIWTREMIPYKYLEFFEIKNKEFPKELGF